MRIGISPERSTKNPEAITETDRNTLNIRQRHQVVNQCTPFLLIFMEISSSEAKTDGKLMTTRVGAESILEC